jgi:hypothetical protein
MSTVVCDGVADGVDPKVSTCRGNGSGGTEINIGSLLTVDQDGGVAEGVDAKDTTCHLNGSGCTGINNGSMWTVGRDGGGVAEVVDDTPSLGYQHLYKSSNMSTSSRRVLSLYRMMSKHIVPRGKNARKREGRKMTKIRSLEQVLPSQAHSLEKEYLTRNAIFFSGTPNGMFPNPVRNSITQSVVKHLNIIDTVDGAQMVLRNGNIVFILIPWRHAILKTTHVKKTSGSLHALHLIFFFVCP